ncbi:hypothetical protein BKH42_02145 [Helicobacter sp. 13S00482-2]|uniref:hypothetical protein n=1 Tax=Helicobacter sp. 13S00482-2 TaxID=1476200 RepID=UPI000BA51D5A|nr:hypothetical protein [Helicobacter sp. 13S00482-2]PAF54325.1 hypothetical protein BKH42_02145 [Helicobacter sp. 13S00482-2]
MRSASSIFGNFAEKDMSRTLTQGFERNMAKDILEANIKYQFALWHWLFNCRRQLYRDRIFFGLKRDENLNAIRDEKGNIEFLEQPNTYLTTEGNKLLGLRDDHLYQKLLLDRLHPMYKEFIIMLGNGDEVKGKDVLRQKFIKEEYALSTQAVEYAKAKIFFELNADAEYLKRINLCFDGTEKNYTEKCYTFSITDRYFGLKMEDKMDKDYEDKLADARLGGQRFSNWKKDKYDRDRAKIQIDFYVKEWIAQNGEDRFVLFDHLNEEMIRPEDFKNLLTRYASFVPICVDIYNKYEVMMWGAPAGKSKGTPSFSS